MTPWLFAQTLKGFEIDLERRHNHDAWMMWHGAQLSNADPAKFPPLDRYRTITTKKQVQGIDETAILTRLKAYNLRLEKEKNGISR